MTIKILLRLFMLSFALAWAACSAGAIARDRPSQTLEVIRFAGPIADLQLALTHRKVPVPNRNRPVALILHGTNVAASGNAAFPFGGGSMLDGLNERGIDAWALDFYGFGESDRYPQMAGAPDGAAPLGRATETARQVEAAIRFLRTRLGVRDVVLIADSGSTIPGGMVASQQPDLLSRLVLFGPITPFSGGAAPEAAPAYRLVVPDALWKVFTRWSDDLGAPLVLDPADYPLWAQRYLDSDPTSRTRMPPSVRVPNGPAIDMAEVGSGKFPYDPGQIRAATLVVMGETDQVTTLAGAQWLLSSLRNAQRRRMTVIGHATHLVQFEAERKQLYDVLAAFISEPISPAR